MPQVIPSAHHEKSTRIRTIVLISVVLAAIILAVYMQAGNQPFVFDDEDYVTGNPHVASGMTTENIVWAFTSIHSSNWHPITWLSHMADVQLYGLNPRGHHLTNVAIHAVAAVLLLLFLLRVTGSLWQSSFVAALFALHPLHVESVAWVAERKDVLSALFGFLTLFFYAEFAAKRKATLYLAALFSFALGLMSKPMLVTFPMVMLLIDYWPLGRYRREEQGKAQGLHHVPVRVTELVKEKIPFFACSLVSGIVTIYAQHAGESIGSLKELPFALRIENALFAYVEYLIKTFWPHDLAVMYPLPSWFPLWQVAGSLLVLLLVSAAAIRFGRRFPYLPVGWFWFLITLVPVIGLIQVGDQSMADRYSYLALTGIFIMVAWGAPDMARGLPHQDRILALLAGVVIVASAALTWHQLGYWHDNIDLYRHTLQVAPGSSIIHNNLGIALAGKGDLDGAIREYRDALRINPNDATYYNNLGTALDEKGDIDAAIREYRMALQLSPGSTDVLNNLGLALARKGLQEVAITEYRKALLLNPDYAVAHYNLGLALAGKGDLDAAIREYRETLRINPDFAGASDKLGVALAQKRMNNGGRN